MLKLSVVDSHTAGEPTRVLPLGAIELPGATMVDRRSFFQTNLDHLRRAILCEPRGSEILVGAVLTPPAVPGSDIGVVFFNNAAYLGMCGHGTIGVVETLRHLGILSKNQIKIDTPAGTVEATVSTEGIAVRNVPAYRTATKTITVPGLGQVTGDVAYGGNWFFIVRHPELPLSLPNAPELTALCTRIRRELENNGVTGDNSAEIDHIELSGPATVPGADSKNFVLCPGAQYDRSPCGTGTSAKLACLAEDGQLAAGQPYIQESITGSTFSARIDRTDGQWIPTIAGRAYITAESTLIFDPEDPFRWGIA